MDGIIRISNHAENPTNAIQSVINNSSHFKKLHIVCPFYDKNVLPFENYNEVKEQLQEAGVDIILCTSLNMDKLGNELSLEIPPYCIVKTGGFDKLAEIHKELDRTDNTSITHFGLCPQIYVPERNLVPDLLDGIFGYGFFLVTFVMDFIWRIWSRDKIYLHTDVQAVRICSMGRRKFLPQVTFMSRIRNTTHLPVSNVNSATFIPPVNGLSFSRWNLNMHPKQRFGLWMVTFCFLYIFMAFPWWNYIISVSYLQRPLFHPLFIALYIICTCTIYLASTYYMNIPNQFMLCMMHPIYFALYPLFFVYSKLYRPNPKLG